MQTLFKHFDQPLQVEDGGEVRLGSKCDVRIPSHFSTSATAIVLMTSALMLLQVCWA